MIETTSFGVRTGKYLPERSSCLDMGGSRSRPCRDAEDRMLHLVRGTVLWRSIDQAPLRSSVQRMENILVHRRTEFDPHPRYPTGQLGAARLRSTKEGSSILKHSFPYSVLPVSVYPSIRLIACVDYPDSARRTCTCMI
jgi:hypothetical protein